MAASKAAAAVSAELSQARADGEARLLEVAAAHEETLQKLGLEFEARIKVSLGYHTILDCCEEEQLFRSECGT